MLDGPDATRAVLDAGADLRPDLVRAMWQPLAGMYRFVPGMDLLDAHRGSFGFPLEGRDDEVRDALARLTSADAWARFENALERAAEALAPHGPLPGTLRVLLVPGDPGDPHFMEEVAGLSAFGGISGYIVVTLWPHDAVLQRLEAIAAHELHHNVRYSPGGVAWNPMSVTVGEQVVAEGLADAFARDLHGDDGLSYLARGARGDRAVLERVAEGLGVTGMQNFTAWIHGDASARRFGAQPVGLPTGAGYAAGLEIADAYLAETGHTAAEAVCTPSEDVLAVALPALGL